MSTAYCPHQTSCPTPPLVVIDWNTPGSEYIVLSLLGTSARPRLPPSPNKSQFIVFDVPRCVAPTAVHHKRLSIHFSWSRPPWVVQTSASTWRRRKPWHSLRIHARIKNFTRTYVFFTAAELYCLSVLLPQMQRACPKPKGSGTQERHQRQKGGNPTRHQVDEGASTYGVGVGGTLRGETNKNIFKNSKNKKRPGTSTSRVYRFCRHNFFCTNNKKPTLTLTP